MVDYISDSFIGVMTYDYDIPEKMKFDKQYLKKFLFNPKFF